MNGFGEVLILICLAVVIVAVAVIVIYGMIKGNDGPWKG